MSAQVEQLALLLRMAQRRLRERLDGLTDAEYLWEPVDGCWNVRPRASALGDRPEGGGEWRFDHSDDQPAPAPFTTIAWRLMHLTDCIGAYHLFLWTDQQEPPDNWLEVAPAADAGIALWDHHATAFLDALAGEDDASLARPVRIPWWPAEVPRWQVVANVVAEATHHGAEIGVIRDLYLRRQLPPG
ncbi:MAG TPA: DinB family protein [Candidatus Dormibacteraeota bacterium]|nr:DinB family protein [Candidatus Dormibacteraeota bacterium]